MRLVIDASAVLAILLNEELNSKIINLTKGMEIISPSTLPWEIGNALIANFRRKRIGSDDIDEAVKNYQFMDIRLIDVDLEKSVKLAQSVGIYAYDAYVLYCAQKLNLPLLTIDHRMIEVASTLNIKTVEVD